MERVPIIGIIGPAETPLQRLYIRPRADSLGRLGKANLTPGRENPDGGVGERPSASIGAHKTFEESSIST